MDQHTLGQSHTTMGAMNLPSELWLETVELIAPSDVLALGQTNRSLRRIFCQKALWKRVLRAFCRQRGIFVGAYPLEEMHLAHLQRACMGPERWNKLRHAHGVPPHPLTDVTPLAYAAKLDREWEMPSAFCLVPGGRFFVTVAKLPGTVVRMELWDLGVPGGSQPFHAVSMASVDLDVEDDTPRCVMHVDATSDDVLGIAIIPPLNQIRPGFDYKAVGPRTLITVVSIRPGDKEPTFELHTPIYVKMWSPAWRISFGRDCLFLQSFRETDYFVYYFSDHRYTAWSMAFPQSGVQIIRLPTTTTTGDCLAVLEEYKYMQRISVWSAQSIRKYSQPVPETGMVPASMPDELPPSFRLIALWPESISTRLWTHPSRPNDILLHAHNSPYRLHFVYSYNPHSIKPRDHPRGQPPGSHNVSDLIELSRWTIPRDPTDTWSFTLDLKEGVAYRRTFGPPLPTSVPSDTVLLPMESILPPSPNIDKSTLELNSTVVLDNNLVSSLCPVSGRVLYRRRGSASEPQYLYIVDYLC
ncbi:hypothetical protein NMY22_g10299 [Coprinellus aureogranulatus]|nr:hypothetical protein NMY22_g10299 [Coprinellus aureogranulatus]